jgi:hypothetical protein
MTPEITATLPGSTADAIAGLQPAAVWVRDRRMTWKGHRIRSAADFGVNIKKLRSGSEELRVESSPFRSGSKQLHV